MFKKWTNLIVILSGLWILQLILTAPLWPAETELRLKIAPPPPTPARLTLSVAFQEPSGNAALDAGETGRFLVTVTNHGPGTAHGVSLRLKALEGGQGVTLPEPMRVGDIPAGKESRHELPLSASRGVATGRLRLQVEGLEANGFDADPVVVQLSTRAFEPPALAVVDMGINDTSQNAQVEPMEVVFVTARQREGQSDPGAERL